MFGIVRLLITIAIVVFVVILIRNLRRGGGWGDGGGGHRVPEVPPQPSERVKPPRKREPVGS
jgi:hypothetical protein